MQRKELFPFSSGLSTFFEEHVTVRNKTLAWDRERIAYIRLIWMANEKPLKLWLTYLDTLYRINRLKFKVRQISLNN